MKYIKEGLIIILLIWVSLTYVFKPVKTEIEIVRDTTYIPVEVEVAGDPVIKWKEKEVKDTTGIAELNSVIDSLQAEMNKLVDSTGTLGTYTATLDSTITDSTGAEIGSFYLEAISRIPFDPELKMSLRASIINREIKETITIHKGLTFWQRFGISAQVGAGMGLTTKVWDIYAGVGVHFTIL